MQGDNHGQAFLGVEVGEQIHHPARRHRIERGNWFVGEDDVRALHQRTGDGPALLLPTRQGGGAAVGIFTEANPVERGDGPGALVAREKAGQAAPARHPAKAADQHVRHQGQAANEIELLKDEAERAADITDFPGQLATRLDIPAADIDAAAVTEIEPGETAQQR